MEVRTRDTYRVQLSGTLSSERIFSLMELYQPLIGQPAVILYLTLAAESSNTRMQDRHERILTLTGLDPQSFDRALSKLEEYMLVRVYEKTAESKNSYVYLLHVPMNASDFAKANIYVSRYIHKTDAKMYENTAERLMAGEVSLSGFRDITRKIVHVEDYGETEPVHYVRVQPKYNFAEDDSIVFDYDTFLRSVSNTMFPVACRTDANLELIGRLATVYGIEPKRMAQIVGRCSVLTTDQLDIEKLRTLAAREQPVTPKTADPYQLPPKSFLQSKMNGRPVTMVDSKTLEYLSVQMHFAAPVINVMIEYILEAADSRLTRGFVESVAGEWARRGINTKEEALLAVNQAKAARRQNPDLVVIEAPQYIKDAAAGKVSEGTRASKETIEKFRERQNRSKG